MSRNLHELRRKYTINWTRPMDGDWIFGQVLVVLLIFFGGSFILWLLSLALK